MVEIKIHSKRKAEIEFELIGEGHAFAKLLMNKLLNTKDVDIAEYLVEHPLLSSPYFYVKVKKGDPKKIVSNAFASLHREIKV